MAKMFTFISLLVASVVALGCLVNAKSEEDCTQAGTQCSRIATEALDNSTASNEEKCQKVKESLTCLKDIQCYTDINFRLLFLRAEEKVKDMNCDLSSEFYPPLTGPPESCPRYERVCLFNYTHTLMIRNQSSHIENEGYVLCQDLTEYIGCRQINNCTDKEKLKQIVMEEEGRMQVDCVVPQVTDSYTFQECATAMGQCETLDDAATDSGLCSATLKALNCSVSLNCASDVHLRLLKHAANKTLAEKGIENCDIGIIFAEVEKTSNDCEEGLKMCVDNYVEILLEKDAAQNVLKSELCSELDKFLACERDVNSCDLNTMELKELADSETQRMRTGTCKLTSLNHGSWATASLHLTAVMSFSCLLFTFMNVLHF